MPWAEEYEKAQLRLEREDPRPFMENPARAHANYVCEVASELEFLKAGQDLLHSLHNGCTNLPKTYTLSMVGAAMMDMKNNEVANVSW